MSTILISFHQALVAKHNVKPLIETASAVASSFCFEEPSSQRRDLFVEGDLSILFLARHMPANRVISRNQAIADMRKQLTERLEGIQTSVHEPGSLKVFKDVPAEYRPGRLIKVAPKR